MKAVELGRALSGRSYSAVVAAWQVPGRDVAGPQRYDNQNSRLLAKLRGGRYGPLKFAELFQARHSRGA